MFSYFKLLQSRSTKMLSMHRPLPSMLIVMPWAFSTPIKSSLVNWLPWARASARTGGALSLAVEDLRPSEPSQRLLQRLDTEVGVQGVGLIQDKTAWLCQSMITTKYRKPRGIGI